MEGHKKTYDSSYFVLSTENGIVTGHSGDRKKILKNELEVYPHFKEYFEKAIRGEVSNVTEVSTTTKKKMEYIFLP